MLNLYPDQEARVWGTVINSGEVDLPFLVVDYDNGMEAYPCDIPDDLCYVTTSDGRELAALREYGKPSIDDCIWIRLIDEEIRGMNEDELHAWIFSPDFSGYSFALVAPE